MFSKEWFIYVFGRWLLLAGIAGALLQFLLCDRLAIHTIPAFLLNQFLLACVFWYVDKYIFQRHFSRVKAIFKFPRIKGDFNCNSQFSRISQEFAEYAADFDKSPDKPQGWLHRFLDLAYAVEMMERLLREKGIAVDAEYYSIVRESEGKGLYS